MGITDRVVLVVDSGKFAASAAVLLCGWDEVSAVITEAQPPTPIVEQLGASGVLLHVAAAADAPKAP